MRLCDHSVCYLITDENKAGIDELLINTGEYIRVENMDCVWDFIYEVHE